MTQREVLLAQRAHIDRQLTRLCRREAQDAPHKDVGINEMTAEIWRQMTASDRRAWTNWWRLQGLVSFACLNCGFPTETGRAGCEACIDHAPALGGDGEPPAGSGVENTGGTADDGG